MTQDCPSGMPSLWCLRELRCPKFLRREPTRTDRCGVILMPHKHHCYVFLLSGMWYFRMLARIKHFSDLSMVSISAGPPSVAFFFWKVLLRCSGRSSIPFQHCWVIMAMEIVSYGYSPCPSVSHQWRSEWVSHLSPPMDWIRSYR